MKVSVPAPRPTRAVDFPRLDGGLNLWELDYRLDSNQSPEMKNLWWQDGVLQCRDGQRYVTDASDLGTGYTCFRELFWDCAFFHIGTKLYYLPVPLTTLGEELLELKELCGGVPENRGTFFRYGDWLFYKNRGGFFKITYDPDGDPVFSAGSVVDDAYTPVIAINADPSSGAGDLYQPENRISPKKTIRYNAEEGATVYQLPVTEVDSVDEVIVGGETLAAADYTVDLVKGTVTFKSAPPVTDPPTNNTVEITYSKANEDAYNSVMDCPYVEVYGGDQCVCLVLGGCSAQPNAFFWNGNDDVSMNAAYFPMSFYNLAGDTEDRITGFGRQYGHLIVFKEKSVGKANFNIVDVDGRNSIQLTYTAINSRIGCDLPWSIQLIDNNLVFCNSYQGVHLVRDSTAALENNIECLSRNVNGTAQRPGLLEAVRAVGSDAVCSFDDDNRYWLCANGQVFMWDYLLSAWKAPSWFYLTNIKAVSFFSTGSRTYHVDAAGRVTLFRRDFMDYGGAIEKVYQFPPQFFDTYDQLKDIMSCLFAVRSDTDSVVRIQYQTDYETREDLTDISSMSWHLAPRNLAYRCLSIQRFAHVARRRPGCRHVRHFAMRLYNNEIAQDLAIVSAQIYYRYTGRER